VSAYSGPEDYLTRPGINLGYQPLFYGGGLIHNVPGLGTNMKIGESAFTTPGWLGSTIGHENVHLQQALDGTFTNVEPGSSQNEVDAYNWELSNADHFWLTDSEIAKLNTLITPYLNIVLFGTPTPNP
jgi:hypothetical protein